jgi:hypothetical protein
MQRFLSAAAIACLGVLPAAPVVAQSPDASPAGGVRSPERPIEGGTGTRPSTGSAAAGTPKKSSALLSDEAELTRVAGLYEAGKYLQCSTEIERLLDPTGHTLLRQPAIVESARVYWAACLLGVGESEAADAPLRAAIHENPQMKPPDSLVFPQPVIERFLKVRDSLINEIRAAEQARIRQAQAEARQRQQALERDRNRMRALEKLAEQETVVIKNRRWLAALPFGVGQFQNREAGLGTTLLVSQVLLSAASLTAVIVQSKLATQADELRRSGGTVDEERLQQSQRAWGTVKTVSFWAFAALAAGGIAQAQIEFVPEVREYHRRPLPPGLAPSPAPAQKPGDVSALPYFDRRGGGLSFSGRF